MRSFFTTAKVKQGINIIKETAPFYSGINRWEAVISDATQQGKPGELASLFFFPGSLHHLNAMTPPPQG